MKRSKPNHLVEFLKQYADSLVKQKDINLGTLRNGYNGTAYRKSRFEKNLGQTKR